MKKILFSLFLLSALTLSVSAQNAKKDSQATTPKKECCDAHKTKKDGCCADKKKGDAKKESTAKKGDCAKKSTTAETKSAGKN
jgi:hypothetical protein